MNRRDREWIIKIIGQLKNELEAEIRREGVLRENTQAQFEGFREAHDTLVSRTERLEISIDELREKTEDYPALKSTVKKHSLKIQKLQKR